MGTLLKTGAKTMLMTEYNSYEEARKNFTWDQTWEVFDGTPENFNMGHECIDRHVGNGTALRIFSWNISVSR